MKDLIKKSDVIKILQRWYSCLGMTQGICVLLEKSCPYHKFHDLLREIELLPNKKENVRRID
jgi:hypothetical protein